MQDTSISLYHYFLDSDFAGSFFPTISLGQLWICVASFRVTWACKHIYVSFSSPTQMVNTFLTLWLGALFSDVIFSLRNGIRRTQPLETGRDWRDSRCPDEEVFSALPSQNGFGIPLLVLMLTFLLGSAAAAWPSSPLLRERYSSKAGLISLHLPLSFPRLHCKISSFFFAICFTSPSIPKPQLF